MRIAASAQCYALLYTSSVTQFSEPASNAHYVFKLEGNKRCQQHLKKGIHIGLADNLESFIPWQVLISTMPTIHRIAEQKENIHYVYVPFATLARRLLERLTPTQ